MHQNFSFKVFPLFFLFFLGKSSLKAQTTDHQSKLSVFAEAGGGSSYYLGLHHNATVTPGISFSISGGILYPIANGKNSLGLSLGYGNDIQQIASTSSLGSATYDRSMNFVDVSLGLSQFFHKSNRFSLQISPRIRILTGGKLLKSGYKPGGIDLDREELNVSYFRTVTPGLEISPGFRIWQRAPLSLDLRVKMYFSMASTDFTSQPGTLNNTQLSLRLLLCNP